MEGGGDGDGVATCDRYGLTLSACEEAVLKKHRRRSSSKGSLMPAEAVVILRGFRVATRRSRRMFDHWRCTFYRPDGVHRI